MNFDTSDIIFLIPWFIFFFIAIVEVGFYHYTTYTKKCKKLQIAEKFSEIVNDNKAIRIIEKVGAICFTLTIIQFFGLFVLALFNNIDRLPKDLFGLLALINVSIWYFSILVTNIYYIFVHIKVIKENKI